MTESHPCTYPGIGTRDVQKAIGNQCLRELWRIYDLGGESVGRSLQADLLECGMSLLMEDTEHSVGRLSDDRLLGLAKEACRRRSRETANAFYKRSGYPSFYITEQEDDSSGPQTPQQTDLLSGSSPDVLSGDGS
jgi:hypothetical protein